ncbi:DNA cytosine methyltransferase [Streptomyces mobaraensis NBRC 13819 = DSM 40847]|uniref:DNA cytosine methyltransferase n=1 Tax=Streptomyces mobaraensis TaxID=35621 RepID=UPI000594343B|nr:DNA cytosine methyltransferase [Streptomyces mobaraensis]QTT76543.1 DNA cytosine methyltransferase [Streptomyces mobaraensis NBRC 13819 = DSM 40847]
MASSDTDSGFLKDPHILDLFAGPGGLDVAAHMLGVPSLGIEWDKNACETRYAAGLPTLHADVSAVRQHRFEELPKALNVLAGGPPCQTYSVAGSGAGRKALDKVEGLIHDLVAGADDQEIDKRLATLEGSSPEEQRREGWKPDRRTALVLEPLRYAIKALHSPNRDRRPFDVIVLEQVPQVKALWEVYREVLESGLPGADGRKVKYKVAKVETLRTEAYGVPQTRRRAILIARLEQHGAPSLPGATHHTFNPHKPKQGGPEDEKAVAQAAAVQTALPIGTSRKPPVPLPWVHMWEVLGKTERLPGGRKSSFKIVSNYGSGGDPKNRGVRTDRQPSFTVTGKVSRNAVLNPDGTPQKPDRLTIREAGILQTFPPNYPWSGGDRSQQVGNAVPPLFGMHVLTAALGLPPLTEEAEKKLRKNWREYSYDEVTTFRKEGCGEPDGCGPGCPKPEDQAVPSKSSRPRTGASAKRSEK